MIDRRSNWTPVAWSVVLLAACVVGWRAWDAMGPLPEGCIARVSGVAFDRDDLARDLGAALEFDTVSEARRTVDRFVGRQVLRLAAQARGEAPDELLERLVEERGAPAEVTDADVRVRYERDRHLYERPEQVRLAYAVVPVSSGTPAAREDLRRLSEQILMRARLHPARRELALWIPRSEARAHVVESGPWPCDAPRGQRADDGAAAPPDALLDASCALRAGRLTPVVETPDAFYVGKTREKSRAWRKPFARVAREIRSDLERERFETARRRESDRLRRRANVRIGLDAIAALVTSSTPEEESAVGHHGPPLPPGAWEEPS